MLKTSDVILQANFMEIIPLIMFRSSGQYQTVYNTSSPPISVNTSRIKPDNLTEINVKSIESIL